MEDDVRNVPQTGLAYSSSLLTDWLFKYKIDNISYLSSPPSLHAHFIKSSRKGGIFDSRDIIRPTVQLFKNIRNKTKKRNETPSPQRNKPKGNTIPSPTKESNRIFNHKAGGENTLDSYRKIYTYGRVKQDKVSRDKIESAVALYRQREQEKENAANKSPPEKNKRIENKEVVGGKPKSRKSAKPNKPTTKEKNLKVLSKSEEKQNKESQEIIKNNSLSRDTEKKSSNEDIKKNEELEKKERNKRIKRNTLIKVGPQMKKTRSKGKEKYEKDNSISEEENKDINTLDKTIDKNVLSSKSTPKLNKINSNIDTERSEVNVINFMKNLEIEASRASLIKSLKSKYSHQEVNRNSVDGFSNVRISQGGGEVLSNRKLPTADYIIIKPAFASSETVNPQSGIKPKIKKSVDDLLREYRIKYRNMIKLR